MWRRNATAMRLTRRLRKWRWWHFRRTRWMVFTLMVTIFLVPFLLLRRSGDIATPEHPALVVPNFRVEKKPAVPACRPGSCPDFKRCVRGVCVDDMRPYPCSERRNDCPAHMFCDNGVCHQGCKLSTQKRDARGFCKCTAEEHCLKFATCEMGACVPTPPPVCTKDQLLYEGSCRNFDDLRGVIVRAIRTRHIAQLTLIINVYKRTAQLFKQLLRILQMSVLPKHIVICIFGSPKVEEMQRVINTFQGVIVGTSITSIVSNFNFMYYGRFMTALKSPTKYVAFLDDDQIPGSRVLEKLIAAYKEIGQTSIIGMTGRRFALPEVTGSALPPYHKAGNEGMWMESSCNVQESVGGEGRMVQVDGLNRHWFISTEAIRYLFIRQPYSFSTMEDYTFSAMAWKHAHMPTYTICPRTVEEHMELDEGDQGSSTNFEDMNMFRANMINRLYFGGYTPAACLQNRTETLLITEPRLDIVSLAQRRDVRVAVVVSTPIHADQCFRTNILFCVDASAPMLVRMMEDVVTSLHGILCTIRPKQVSVKGVASHQMRMIIGVARELYDDGAGCEVSCSPSGVPMNAAKLRSAVNAPGSAASASFGAGARQMQSAEEGAPSV